MSTDIALVAERLRDDLEAFRRKLRKQYTAKSAQVSSAGLRKEGASLAERGLVDICGLEQFGSAVGPEVNADLTLEFQRLLTASGKSATRGTYENSLSGILNNFAGRVVVPLKQAGSRNAVAPVTTSRTNVAPTAAFLGHSFDSADAEVVLCVRSTFESLGIPVITGERPRADRISEKVKRLIEAQPVFVGLYTRRDKIARKAEWTTSAWVIEEKAYAVAMRRKLVLLKEQGIANIGGLQGDYEYIDFSRSELHHLVLRILRLFTLEVASFAE